MWRQLANTVVESNNVRSCGLQRNKWFSIVLAEHDRLLPETNERPACASKVMCYPARSTRFVGREMVDRVHNQSVLILLTFHAALIDDATG